MWDLVPLLLLKKLILEKAGMYLQTENFLVLDLELGPLSTARAGPFSVHGGGRHICALSGDVHSQKGGSNEEYKPPTLISSLWTQGCDKTEGGESGT